MANVFLHSKDEKVYNQFTNSTNEKLGPLHNLHERSPQKQPPSHLGGTLSKSNKITEYHSNKSI
jgi:hypothetical protein